MCCADWFCRDPRRMLFGLKQYWLEKRKALRPDSPPAKRWRSTKPKGVNRSSKRLPIMERQRQRQRQHQRQHQRQMKSQCHFQTAKAECTIISAIAPLAIIITKGGFRKRPNTLSSRSSQNRNNKIYGGVSYEPYDRCIDLSNCASQASAHV